MERCPGGSSLWSGACPSGEFAIQQRFTLNIDQFRSRFPPLCQPKTLRVAETMTQALFWDTATHPEQPSAVAERYHDRDHQRVAPGEWFTLQQQVLVNLLMNAMDALAETPPAHRRVSITTEVRAADVEFGARHWNRFAGEDQRHTVHAICHLESERPRDRTCSRADDRRRTRWHYRRPQPSRRGRGIYGDAAPQRSGVRCGRVTLDAPLISRIQEHAHHNGCAALFCRPVDGNILTATLASPANR